MLKIRAMGTTEELTWFKGLNKWSNKIDLLSASEILPNIGTNNYFRAYFDISRREIPETNNSLNNGRKEMCRTICVCNQKGGVAKSVTVCNLAVALAQKGKRVLVIDGDSQGSLTASLGFHDPDNMDVTLATIMGKIIDEKPLQLGEGILHHFEGIDLMPANIELASLEVSMINIIGREGVLKRYIDSIKDQYDFILVDCNPSLGMITINALTASDSVLTPLQASYLPVKGLQQLIKTIGIVRRQLKKNLRMEGILLTMVDSRTSFAKDICELIRTSYGEQIRIFRKNIPRSVRVEEATAEGVSIFTHDKYGKVAKAYASLAEEVLSNEE